MSYEGYVQVLCANGHYSTYDCWDDPFGLGYGEETVNPICNVCGAKLVWRNGVDITNGCDAIPEVEDTEGICGGGLHREEIDKRGCAGMGCGYISLEVKSPAIMCECGKCGHSHEIAPATYHIPEKK